MAYFREESKKISRVINLKIATNYKVNSFRIWPIYELKFVLWNSILPDSVSSFAPLRRFKSGAHSSM